MPAQPAAGAAQLLRCLRGVRQRRPQVLALQLLLVWARPWRCGTRQPACTNDNMKMECHLMCCMMACTGTTSTIPAINHW